MRKFAPNAALWGAGFASHTSGMVRMDFMTPYYQDDQITIYHGDCREILPSLSPVDAIITDPPYGIGFAAQPTKWQRRAGHTPKSWDDEPADVDGLVGLAPICVLWGGNYFILPPSRGWLVWHKPDAPPSMAPVELAWTNQDMNAGHISHSISATNAERVGHPTQKPLRVMKWTIQKVGAPRLICDPYTGSGTILRAAKDMGLKAIGIDVNEHYCEMAANRMSQGILTF